MIRYLRYRFGLMVVSSWAFITILFALTHFAPGNYLTVRGGMEQDGLAGEVLARAEARVGLDQPFHIQYLAYFKNCYRDRCIFPRSYNDLSQTFFQNLNGANQLWYSARRGSLLLFLGLIYSGFLGIMAAVHRGRSMDKWLRYTVSFLESLPFHLVCMYIRSVICNEYGLSSNAPYGASGIPNLFQLSMPFCFCLFLYTRRYMRMFRDNMVEVLRSDYIRTAKAKGLPYDVVLLQHATLPAIVPLMGRALRSWATILAAGEYITETSFSLTGISRKMMAAVSLRDVPFMIGLSLYLFLMVQFASVLSDLLLIYIDPKMKQSILGIRRVSAKSLV